MELLDQREWDVLAAIESYGVRLGVRSNDPGMIDQLAEILPYNHKPLVEASPTVDRLYSIWIDGDGEAILYVDAHLHGRGAVSTVLTTMLEPEMKLYAAERARGWLFVHAGVVGAGDGAVLVPGTSRSGKTTLVREMVLASEPGPMEALRFPM